MAEPPLNLDQAETSSAPPIPRRAIAAATIGNALEFYDFMTFAFFAIQIGHTFFPSGDPFISLMSSLATFGAGFVTRPLGAHILGGYADRVGRKPAMLLSMTLMGVAITMLALTPSYARIGVAAPVMAIGARLLQGFALGGEIGSASSYMIEAAAPLRRGFSISLQSASQSVAAAIGSFVGLALSAVMTPAGLENYGWRIALLLGASIVPFALMIRRSLPETLGKAIEEHAAAPEPLRAYTRPLVLGFLMIGSSTIVGYIFQYMATYGQATLKLSPGVSFAAESINNGVAVFAAIIGGLLCDRYGRRPIMILPRIAFTALIIPVFLWLTSARDATSFLSANAILSFVDGLVYGAVYAAIIESVPPHIRARAFALVYSIPVAVFGGTTQLVVTWLLHATGSAMSIAWYLVAVSLIGLGAMMMMPETAPAKLARKALAVSGRYA
ncbi:MAG: MFS transporter [Sphingomicrobium sp.]